MAQVFDDASPARNPYLWLWVVCCGLLIPVTAPLGSSVPVGLTLDPPLGLLTDLVLWGVACAACWGVIVAARWEERWLRARVSAAATAWLLRNLPEREIVRPRTPRDRPLVGHLPPLSSTHRSHDPDASRKPVLTKLEVSDTLIGTGMPVTITWALDGADEVVVDGTPGLPAEGEATLHLRSSRAIELVAVNRSGTTTARTPVITLVPVPRIVSVKVPTALTVNLRTNVTTSVETGSSSGRTVADQLPARTGPPGLPVLGVPDAFIRWFRGPSGVSDGGSRSTRSSRRNP